MKLKIVRDENSSPREWDNLGTMVCWHPRINLGDEQISRDSAQEFFDDLAEDCIILPLYLYEHSGITIQTKPFSCMWDSGQVGFIYVTPKKLLEEYGPYNHTAGSSKDEAVAKAKTVLEDEVKVYNQFIQGDVWGFVLENECGECNQVTDQEDSCFGFFGDDLEGIKEHLAEEYWPMLETAWEERS